MEIKTFPNPIRPGVGMAPRREGQRPQLPQHSRHCPVLEAGSALGYLVYPALKETESFHLEYLGDGRYRLLYFHANKQGQWQPMFTVTLKLPSGGIGMTTQEVTFPTSNPPISKDDALMLARAFIIPEDFGTPPGAVALRAATNFRTPKGWDTVYSPVFNLIDRPVAPMLVVRVETDWYPHYTEFRYVLQPGESLPGTHNMPVGQVFFLPRQEHTLTACSPEEVAGIGETIREFLDQKEKAKQKTPLGLTYSPHYAHESSRQKKGSGKKKT